MTSEREVLFNQCGHAGIITLNRPKALNAVTLNMVDLMTAQLRQWADDDTIAHVIIKAAPGRAFSAGGDIVQLYEWGRAGDPQFIEFYRREYRLNRLIKRYPKPYIALIDGIVMGGGVGVSFNGSHRVVGENLTFAMPETGIGLFPDVGGTWFLPRCPGAIGMYLGLTGARVKAADALFTGLASHFANSDNFAEIEQNLCDSADIGDVLARLAPPPEPASLATMRETIDRHFSHENLEAVLVSLTADQSEWAQKTLAILNQKSPTSLKITFRQLTEGATLNFEQALQLEFRLVNMIAKGNDFFEGTRAVVIDKDMAPKWQPASLSQISDRDSDQWFAPLAQELTFDEPNV